VPQGEAALHETGADGVVLYEHCSQFAFEGIVSKRVDRPYTSGPSKAWLKLKCPGWKRDNRERFLLFEGRGRGSSAYILELVQWTDDIDLGRRPA
jgi:ATP-dependent DNA ligase